MAGLQKEKRIIAYVDVSLPKKITIIEQYKFLIAYKK